MANFAIWLLPSAWKDVLGVFALYAVGVIWLIYRWRTRNRPGRREQLSRGMAFMDGFARLFAVVVMLLVGILAAACRASFRPYSRW